MMPGPKPDNTLPGKPGKPGKDRDLSEGEYVPASGGISPGAHPGGIAPTEDPRKDAGIKPEQPEKPEATPKK